MTTLPLRRILLLVASASLAPTLVACGGTSDEAVTEGQSDRLDDCPAAPVRVVASVDQWGSIANELGGDCVDVTTIVTGTTADPHDYEPSPSDLMAFGEAKVVIVNGVDYDHWATDALGNVDQQPVVVDAGDITGQTDGDDPHLWYSPQAVRSVSAAITAAFRTAAPDAGDYFAERASQWESSLRPYDELISRIASASPVSVAMTEPVFERMAEALGISDMTPAGFLDATRNEADPSPGDIAEFETILEDGLVDVLVVNTQTGDPTTERLRSTAESNDIAVVEVTETVPDGYSGFLEWQIHQLEALAREVRA